MNSDGDGDYNPNAFCQDLDAHDDYDRHPDRTGQVYISGHGWAPAIPCRNSVNGCANASDLEDELCEECAIKYTDAGLCDGDKQEVESDASA